MEIKFSEMPRPVEINGSDLITIVQGGINKVVTLTNLLAQLNSGSSMLFNQKQNAIQIKFLSKNNANLLVIDGVNDKIGINTTSPEALLHVVGNVKLGSDSLNGVLCGSSEELTYTTADDSGSVVKALNILRETSYLNIDTGIAGDFSLGSGIDGQVKYICLLTDTSGNTEVLATGVGFTKIRFNVIGDSVILKYRAGSINKWSCQGNNGATFV